VDSQPVVKPVTTLSSLGRILVWDVRFPNDPSISRGPGDSPVPRCDLHVIVNANTAEIIDRAQYCD
jgi:hypothetical protein